MSWTNELLNVYKRLSQNPDSGVLPLSHSTAQAQIEVVIDEQGNFKQASLVEKTDATTIIPVTEKSATRTSGAVPMPLFDKLEYIAGDFTEYEDHEKNPRRKPEEKFEMYMDGLRAWDESQYTHPAVSAIHNYLEKKTLMRDIVNSGLIKLDTKTGKLPYIETKGKWVEAISFGSVSQGSSFVRFVVLYNDMSKETRVWLDTSLHEAFIKFVEATNSGEKELCYATGEMEVATYSHPKFIRRPGDQAKLISAGDKTGYTFRGRFATKEEAFAVGQNFSAEVHNALKWLFANQGKHYGDLAITVWASSLQPVPTGLEDSPFGDIMEENEVYNTLPEYINYLQKLIFGHMQKMNSDDKIMILGIDSSTNGRLSMSIYDELSNSDFFHNIMNWHTNNAWTRRATTKHPRGIRSFGLRELINIAYGSEREKGMECDDNILRQNILRLLPCVIAGKPIPNDLIQTLYNRASTPLSYDKGYNHADAVEALCGIYRAHKKGDISVNYDPNVTDRSYLYGCLLAIADKAESETYTSDDAKRYSNAKRLMVNFAQRPYQTWQTIEEKLQPYLQRNKYRHSIERMLNEIMAKFSVADYEDNSKLSPLYLLGYHQFMAYMYSSKTETADSAESTDNNETKEN